MSVETGPAEWKTWSVENDTLLAFGAGILDDDVISDGVLHEVSRSAEAKLRHDSVFVKRNRARRNA